jgi:hypothetical protein
VDRAGLAGENNERRMRDRKRWPMRPYDTSDYTMDFCKKKAAELRASGDYERVQIIRRSPELRWNTARGTTETISFGQIYVRVKRQER